MLSLPWSDDPTLSTAVRQTGSETSDTSGCHVPRGPDLTLTRKLVSCVACAYFRDEYARESSMEADAKAMIEVSDGLWYEP